MNAANQLLEKGDLVEVTGGLGVSCFETPFIDDQNMELDKGDVLIVLESSSARWVKVLSKWGLVWMYRYNNLRLKVIR